MRLFPRTAGWITLPGSYHRPGTAATDPVETSIGFFLIEHPAGRVLFDAGPSPEVASDPGCWGPAAADFPCRLDPGETVVAQLATLGLAPADIDRIVVSHLHLDHAGDLRSFPGATLYVHEREMADALWPLPGYDAGYYHEPDLLPIRRFDRVAVDGPLDLFGDGKIRILPTPGHTRGHLSLVVELPRTGRVVLPGDACFDAVALERGLPPGDPLPAPGDWRASLDAIGALVAGGALPLFSHIRRVDYPTSANATDVLT